MSDWPMVKLGEVVDLITGFPFKSKEYSDDGFGHKLLRGDNIVQGRFRWEDVKLWPDSKVIEKHQNYWLKEGDVILAMDRPWIEAGLKYAQVTEADLPCLLVQRTSCLRAKLGFDQDFLRYVISSYGFVEYVKLIQTGTAVPHISGKQILDFEFKLPPENVQSEIGKSLRVLDGKIELNRQMNQVLEEIAQAIFKSWFVDFDPTHAKIAAKQAGQDPERAAMAAISSKTLDEFDQLSSEQLEQLKTTAGLFPDALIDSELGEVPEGWEFKKLKDVCRVLNGRAYKNTEFREEGTPIVRIQNLSNGGKGGKTVYSDLDLPLDKLIHSEDFIYAWSATFGPHIWRGGKSIFHYHIWKMDVDESIISRYFLYLSMFRKTEQMKSGATGSIFTHLTKSMMESQEILLA